MWVIISGILGIAGFLISLINLINYFVSHKVNLEITMLEYAYKLGVQGKKRLFVHYKLNNKSQLPISVTDIQLVLNGIEYTEDYNTHEVNSYHHKAKGVDEYVPTYNEHLPINLECLHSHSGYLVFVISEDNSPNLDKGLTFQIRTNRNKEVQKKVSLNEVVTLRSTLPYQKYKNLFLKDKAEHKVH